MPSRKLKLGFPSRHLTACSLTRKPERRSPFELLAYRETGVTRQVQARLPDDPRGWQKSAPGEVNPRRKKSGSCGPLGWSRIPFSVFGLGLPLKPKASWGVPFRCGSLLFLGGKKYFKEWCPCCPRTSPGGLEFHGSHRSPKDARPIPPNRGVNEPEGRKETVQLLFCFGGRGKVFGRGLYPYAEHP